MAGVCKKTGFIYSWCGKCYAEACDAKNYYMKLVDFGDTDGEDGKKAFECMLYQQEMKRQKQTNKRTRQIKKNGLKPIILST